MTLYAARLDRDSIVGELVGHPGQPRPRTTVAVADVQRVEVQRVHALGTAARVLVAAGGAAAVAAMIAAADDPGLSFGIH